jgi:uncharacterized protein YggU (UPF0235/DUF167 family)
MKITVKIKPRSHHNKVEVKDGIYIVHVTQPPVENRANIALVETLSEHFDIPKSRITVVSGFKSRNKIVEIN